jgi:hypothetical protein
VSGEELVVNAFRDLGGSWLYLSDLRGLCWPLKRRQIRRHVERLVEAGIVEQRPGVDQFRLRTDPRDSMR